MEAAKFAIDIEEGIKGSFFRIEESGNAVVGRRIEVYGMAVRDRQQRVVTILYIQM